MSDLDIEQSNLLTKYLRETGRIARGEQVSIQNLAGGVSNRTVLLRRGTGEAWVLKQALPKLRVAVDWYSSPERIYREALGLRWLSEIAPPGTIPRLVFEDRDHYLLAMEAVPDPHENWKQVLLRRRVEPAHVEQFGRLLGLIHHRSFDRRSELLPIFEDRTYFESLRIEPYYRYTAAQVPAAAPFLGDLIAAAWSQRISLVHGDYSPKNILIHKGRLILLDHEVIHFGDPAFDVGFSLTHLLSKANHLPEQRLAFSQAAQDYWHIYLDVLAGVPWLAELEPRAVHHTLACLLARVAGRSPLEYLDDAARARQASAVLDLIRYPPTRIVDLINEFILRLS